MKKLNYVVYIYDTVGNEHLIPPEYAASAHDQLLAGKDVHYWYEDGDTHEMVEVIIPYEAVAVATIYKTSEDVDAPTDAVCNEGGTE